MNQEERCNKCGDTPHIEGFRCPSSRYQCKYHHKIRHFSHLCFKKKQESTYKKGSRNPQEHQLMVGRYSTEGPLYDQEEMSASASHDSFCLQMQIKSIQAEKQCYEPQHLVTNLQYKLKCHRRRTKFLRARIDTCSNVNVMPISVYKLMYKDPDCTKLAPSKKNGIYTYTNEKIPVIGFSELLVLHPDAKCFKRVSFQVCNI